MVQVVAVPVDRLRRCVEAIFVGHGLTSEDARVVTDNLVEADLRGVHSHGVWRVAPYVGDLRSGRTVARPTLTWARDEGAQAVLDGGLGLGQIAMLAAVREALKRTHQHGIGAVAVRNNTHIGALLYWALLAVEENCIAMVISNAGIHMAPWGGRERLVGNNPVAFGAPTDKPWPLVLDMATSVAAGGKVMVAKLTGEKIPPGWSLDIDGNPTEDPNASYALLPFGGHKGYGLAVIFDILSGVLSGGRFGAMLGLPGHSQFFLALEVERYLPLPEFRSRMGELIDQIHSSPLAPGSDRIYLPGEMEHERREQRLREGIPLPVETIESLKGIAAAAGVACELG